MAQNWLTMTFLLCPPYDIITWAGHKAFPQAKIKEPIIAILLSI